MVNGSDVLSGVDKVEHLVVWLSIQVAAFGGRIWWHELRIYLNVFANTLDL